MVRRTNNPYLRRLDRGRTRKGSGFTNLQRILQANVGNRLGETIQRGVGDIASGVRERTGQAKEKFQKESEKKRVDRPENIQFREQTISRAQEGKKPTEEEFEKFSQFTSGQYGGPKELKGAQDLRRQAQDVTKLGKSVRDSGQRLGLLQRFLGDRDYTTGEQRFDELLLGQQPGALRDIKRETFGVERDVGKQTQAAQQRAEELSRRAKAFGEETVEQLEAAADPTLSTLEQRVKEAQEEEARKALALQQVQQALRYQPITDEQGNVIDALPLYGADASIYGNVSGGFFAEDPVARRMPAFRYAMERLRDEGLADEGLIEQFRKMEREGAAVGHSPTGQGPDVASSIDVNPLIADRLYREEAQNLDVAGLATPEQAARLNALAKLAGREQPFDPEEVGDFRAGQVTPKMLSDIRSQIRTANEQVRRDWEAQQAAPPVAIPEACFAAGTMIRMNDGSMKPVEQLNIMDEVQYGGKVLGCGQSLNEGIYNYNGIMVSGSHAVLENGTWIRIQDSNYAEKLHDEFTVVYPIYTERNILITEENVWADFAECPDTTNKTENERLEALNNREDNDILNELNQNLKTKVAS